MVEQLNCPPLVTRSRLILLAIGVVVTIALVIIALWWWLGATHLNQGELTSARIEAVKIALSIGVASGGIFALERLAQGSAQQRQPIVNLFCMYLCATGDSQAGEAGESAVITPVEGGRAQVAERRLRQTVQGLLTRHLSPGDPAAEFWPGIDLDLSGAILTELDLSGCRVRSARFEETIFEGPARFVGTTFEGPVVLSHADFRGDGSFANAEFEAAVDLSWATFARTVDFQHARFAAESTFDGARLGSSATMDAATFAGPAAFTAAQFRMASFRGARFFAPAEFPGAAFVSADFGGRCVFAEEALFNGATFTGRALFGKVQFGS
jgi:uncharacterized protein YjbI with pentapeptide repeats